MVDNSKRNSAVKSGISFGTCLAMVISYTAWKSIGWAIIHGLLKLGICNLLFCKILLV